MQKAIIEELRQEANMQSRMQEQAYGWGTREVGGFTRRYGATPPPTGANLPQHDWQSLSGGVRRDATGKAFDGTSVRKPGVI